MPKIIIPNIYDLYKPDDYELNQEEAISRLFYNFRFLWLLNPGDIIILPESPNNEFLLYLANLKQIDPTSFTVLGWQDALNANTLNIFQNFSLINQLRRLVIDPASWSIHACYFNKTMLKLGDNLNMPIAKKWRLLVENNFIRKLNSKVQFRNFAKICNTPVPKGQVCTTLASFKKAMQSLISLTGQLIIKQEYNGGGLGNIGISKNNQAIFSGIVKKINIENDLSIDKISNQLWADYTNNFNSQLIVEVYYPNKGTFTAILWIPALGKNPILLNYSEIRMDSTWIGVQIPAQVLLLHEINELKLNAMKLASVIQSQGYQGYICCDAIRTNDNQMLFTEINVRPGAETNAHILASNLFGVNYFDQITILTRKGINISSFSSAYQILKEKNLLLTPKNRRGVALLTVEDKYAGQAECLIAAPDLKSAYAMENQLLTLLNIN